MQTYPLQQQPLPVYQQQVPQPHHQAQAHQPPTHSSQSYSQAAQVGHHTSAHNGQRSSGEFDVYLSGTPIIPFAVIFTKEPVDRIKALLTSLVPALASVVKAVTHRGTGDGERCELHCWQSEFAQASAIIPALKGKGVNISAWRALQPTTGPNGLANTAAAGVDNAIIRAGVCRNYYYNQYCPHPSCRFKCYGNAVPGLQHPHPP